MEFTKQHKKTVTANRLELNGVYDKESSNALENHV